MTSLYRFLMLCLTIALLSACDQQGIASSDPAVSFTPGAPSQHWTLINYWAVWCAPCREEIPELNALARDRADSLRVFGVNYDGASGPALAKAITDLGIEFPTLTVDPQPALGIARPQALPVTLLIKPDGTVHEVLLGPQTADGLWQKLTSAAP